VVDSETLVIADNRKALAMAGIMGGDDSAVGDKTTDILLKAPGLIPWRLPVRHAIMASTQTPLTALSVESTQSFRLPL